MGEIAVLDTNIVLAALDPEDAHHQDSRIAIRQYRAHRAELVIPASVFSEALVSTSRYSAAAVAKTEAFIDALVDDVLPIDRAIARVAAKIRADHRSVRLPDAFVVAAGEVLHATVLTADRRLGRISKRVRLLADAY